MDRFTQSQADGEVQGEVRPPGPGTPAAHHRRGRRQPAGLLPDGGTSGWARSARPRRMERAGLFGGNQRGRRAGGECVLADSEPGRGSRGSEPNRAPHEKVARTGTVEDLTVSQHSSWQRSSRCGSAKATSRSPKSWTRAPTSRGTFT